MKRQTMQSAPQPETRRGRFAWLAGLFFAEGLPFGLFVEALPVALRATEASLATVGMVGSLQLAWSLKLLWSPWLDRIGHWKQWAVGSLAVMATSLAALAALVGGGGLARPGAAALALCFLAAFVVASATQDLAIDGASVRLVPAEGEGLANGLRVGAYRAAMLAGGGGVVAASTWVPWPRLLWAAAAALAVVALLMPLAPRGPTADRRAPVGWLAGLRSWATVPGSIGTLGFLCLYKFGDLAMSSMLKPFWLAHGRSPAQIGLVSITLGMCLGVFGALLGGLYVGRRGLFRGLWVLGIWQAVSNLGYAAVALGDLGFGPLVAASCLESVSQGLGTAAQLALITRLCQPAQATFQFALLTAVFGLGRAAAAAAGGVGAQVMGFGPFFLLSFFLCLPAVGCLSAVRRRLGEVK